MLNASTATLEAPPPPPPMSDAPRGKPLLPPFNQNEMPAADAEASPAKTPAKSRRLSAEEIELPARLLHAVGFAAKEDGKYAMTGVMIETNEAKNLLSAIATDGRSLIVAECNRGVFDGAVSVYVPKMIAVNAARVAKLKPSDDGDALVTLHVMGKRCSLTAYTPDGPITFDWTADKDLVFPPYRDVIPDWADSVGVGRIVITSAVVAGALRAMQKVVGKEPQVKVYLPPSADRPLGLESQDGDNLRVLAVVMPAAIDGWMPEKKEKAAEPADPNQTTIAYATGAAAPAANADPEAWRSVRLDTLTPKLKPAKMKVLAENAPPILTIGDVQAWVERKGIFWGKDLKGFGPGGQEQLDEAMGNYWMANPRQASVDPAKVEQSMHVTFAQLAEQGREKFPDGPVPVAKIDVASGVCEAACHPHLLTALSAGKVPALHHIVTARHLTYLCVLPEAGAAGDGVYRLLPLYPEGTQPTEPRKGDEAGDYFGKSVTHGVATYVIGARADGLLVRDGEPDAVPVAQATGGKKPAKKKTTKKK